MSTFKIKNSTYTITPSQEGSNPIVVTGTDTDNFQQDISGMPITEHVPGEFINWMAITEATLKLAVGFDIPFGWLLLLQGDSYNGSPWWDWEEDGAVNATDALRFLQLSNGTPVGNPEKLRQFKEFMADNYEDNKNIGRTIGSETQTLFLGKPNTASDFNLDKHYIVFDSSDSGHRLKLLKFTKGSTFQEGYWFDAGNGSETSGLTTYTEGKISKLENSSELFGNYLSFHPADNVDPSTDLITLTSHGLKDNDFVWYTPGDLHTFNAETAVTIGTDIINIPSHGYSEDDSVLYTFRDEIGDIAPTGLINNRHYFINVVDSDNIKITDKDNNVIDLTGVGLGTSHTLSAPMIPGLSAVTKIGSPRSKYYARVSDANNIKLATGTSGNERDITADGLGTSHELRTTNLLAAFKIGDRVLVDEEASITRASGINTGTDEITTTASHGYSTGDTTEYSAEGGDVPPGIEEGKLYYVIRVSDTVLKLAETSSDATAGTAVNITGVGSGTTHKLLLKFGTTITRIENDLSVFSSTANRFVFTNRNFKKPNFLIDQEQDVLLARVHKRVHKFVTVSAMSFNGADDVGSNKINFPTANFAPTHGFLDGDQVEYHNGSGSTAVGGLTSGDNYFVVNSSTSSIKLAATSGGSAITLSDGAGAGHEIRKIGTSHSVQLINGIDIRAGDTIASTNATADTTITDFAINSSTFGYQISLNQSNKFHANETITITGYVLEPLVSLDESHLEDDNAPVLKADLDVNSKSLKSNSINLKTSGGTKLIETTATEAKLYHSGTEHFKTISGGVQYTGNLSDGTTSIASFTPSGTGLAATDNNTTIPTSATVKAYADTKQAALTFGIANTNAVKVDHASVADDDYAKFTANGLEGRSAAEVKTDLSLNNVENTALSTGTALNATHVTVTDNENENENNLITFIEDASATGNVGLESDGDFHYNPSTGTVTATKFVGDGSGLSALPATVMPTTGGTFTGDVILEKTATVDASNTAYNSRTLGFRCSNWDLDDTTERTPEAYIRLDPTASNGANGPSGSLTFYAGDPDTGTENTDYAKKLEIAVGMPNGDIGIKDLSATFYGITKVRKSKNGDPHTSNLEILDGSLTITAEDDDNTNEGEALRFRGAESGGVGTANSRDATEAATGFSELYSGLNAPGANFKNVFSCYPRCEATSTFIYGNEAATGQSVLAEKFIQHKSDNTNATIGMRDMMFYQYDGAGSANTDMIKPQGNLLTVRTYEGGTQETQLSLDSDGNLTVNGLSLLGAAQAWKIEPDSSTNELKFLYNSVIKARLTTGGALKLDDSVIQNLDQVAPVFTSATTASVKENVASGTTVYTAVCATDTGETSDGSVTFSLVGSNDDSSFSINSSTGVVTINTSPDFETKNSFVFNVRATDGAGNTADRQVTLSITDITLEANEFKFFSCPVASSQSENYKVAEMEFSVDPGSYFLILRHHMTATSNTFANDTCIGAIQILNEAKDTIIKDYDMATSGSPPDLQKTTSVNPSETSTPSQINNTLTFASLTASPVTSQFSIGGSTTSSGTGANDGIGTNFQSGTILPATSSTVAQVSGSVFLYRECSSATPGSSTYVKSTTPVTLPASGFIRIAFHNMGDSSIDPDNTLAVGLDPNTVTKKEHPGIFVFSDDFSSGSTGFDIGNAGAISLDPNYSGDVEGGTEDDEMELGGSGTDARITEFYWRYNEGVALEVKNYGTSTTAPTDSNFTLTLTRNSQTTATAGGTLTTGPVGGGDATYTDLGGGVARWNWPLSFADANASSVFKESLAPDVTTHRPLKLVITDN